jgi:hypothetical protein
VIERAAAARSPAARYWLLGILALCGFVPTPESWRAARVTG